MKFQFEVAKRYDTGLPEWFKTPSGFRWKWNDWVLCKVAWSQGNPPHWCIASSFRERKPGSMECTILNPTYEKMEDFVKIESLHHFQLVKIIEEARK